MNPLLGRQRLKDHSEAKASLVHIKVPGLDYIVRPCFKNLKDVGPFHNCHLPKLWAILGRRGNSRWRRAGAEAL